MIKTILVLLQLLALLLDKFLLEPLPMLQELLELGRLVLPLMQLGQLLLLLGLLQVLTPYIILFVTKPLGLLVIPLL